MPCRRNASQRSGYGRCAIKALSIRQPWAWLICAGYKDIENRSWHTIFRGRIYVHAGKTMDVNVPSLSLTESWILERLSPEQQEVYHTTPRRRGAIIGEVDIVDCTFRPVDSDDGLYSKWAEPGLYGLVLANPVLYDKPILYPGKRFKFFEIGGVKP